jgi:hypothetical protein
LLLIGLTGCRDEARKPAAHAATSISSAADQCTPAIDVIAPSKVPKDVAHWADGRPVVGVGHLWTVRSALDVPPDRQQNSWVLKFPWYTRPFGLPRIDGHRLDGEGTFHSSAGRADDSSGTWVASLLEFSDAGCWEVDARYSDTAWLRFRILVGPR